MNQQPEPTIRPTAVEREPVVTVRGLRKSYAGRVVVDDLDLDVAAGEVLGIIGANGAGKTTTVEILQGLRRADSGTVRVLGLDPAVDSARLRTLVGSQLQDSGLPDRMRVGHAVRLFSGPDAEDGDELLTRFGLSHRRGSAFGTMSGGERQRLFLVLALLNRPRLVVLDELTTGLDPAARREVWAAVRRLRDAGTTVLLVTHEAVDAEAICDRVVAMRAGRVLDAGTPAELVARHVGAASVGFSLPPGPVPAAIESLRGLPGVVAVATDGDRVTVRGDRGVIARAGAWLVERNWIPDDLRADVPTLESALISLLERPVDPDESHQEVA